MRWLIHFSLCTELSRYTWCYLLAGRFSRYTRCFLHYVRWLIHYTRCFFHYARKLSRYKRCHFLAGPFSRYTGCFSYYVRWLPHYTRCFLSLYSRDLVLTRFETRPPTQLSQNGGLQGQVGYYGSYSQEHPV